MALKKPSEHKGGGSQKISVSPKQADLLADKLAGKPYGSHKDESTKQIEEKISRTTISLSKSMSEQVEDIARYNKRSGAGPSTFSAITRDALAQYLKDMKYEV
tara:strand:+ start:2426 stop:2734 length:309 start_codon:yes stop_codon:yes gene_type:complete